MKNRIAFLTTEQRVEAFRKWCKKHGNHDRCGGDCRVCQFNWLEAEYDRLDYFPFTLNHCPFCHGKTSLCHNSRGYSIICECGYRSPYKESEDDAASTHNQFVLKFEDNC